MTKSRPLKVQVGIRDHWAKEDGALQTTLRELQELIGHSVVIEPEWTLLVEELGSFYADKSNMVAIVAGCVQAWAKSMMELLEDSAHEAWADKLLEKVPSRLRVFVDVAASATASTTWSEPRDGFVVSLPKKQVYQPSQLFPIFRGELLASFDVKKKPQLPERTATGGASGAAADGWEGVEVDMATGRAEVVEAPRSSHPSARPKIEFLPDVSSLPRPDQLLLQPPYHLSLVHGHHEIQVHCSHSPSLQVLAEYLKRWCRVNHSDTRNACSPPSLPLPPFPSPLMADGATY